MNEGSEGEVCFEYATNPLLGQISSGLITYLKVSSHSRISQINFLLYFMKNN